MGKSPAGDRPGQNKPTRFASAEKYAYICRSLYSNPSQTMDTSNYNEFGWNDAHPMFYHKLLGEYVERLLPTDGSPILDVGCGNGYFANYLAEKGYCVYGIDASAEGIAIANRTRGG